MGQTLLINPSAFEAGLQAAFEARGTVSQAQRAAFERFAKTGFPHRRAEGWKWSDFNSVLRSKNDDASAPSAIIEPSEFAMLDPFEIRVIDGRIEIETPNAHEGLNFGIVDAVATIADLEAHPLASLNVAMSRKAVGIELADGIQLARPILIRHINTGPGRVFAQSLTRIGEGARACVIETFEGEGTGFVSHLYHLALRTGARLDRYVLQRTSDDAVVHSLCAPKIEHGASFNQSGLSTGGALSRHEVFAQFWGTDAQINLNSVALLGGARHCDFTSEIQFREENCVARQLHKGVAAERASNVFQGKFKVERAAQQTDAKMTANALLLSDQADANHKPELEIYADDVECAHGSTCGSLDDDALFYLRQRGLSEGQARAILVEAFVGEVIEAIDDLKVRSVFQTITADWLSQNG